MRVLFTTVPALGHFFPMVPLARALEEAGHEVAVATAEDFAPEVSALGIAHLPAGTTLEQMGHARAGVARGGSPVAGPDGSTWWPRPDPADRVLVAVRRFARLTLSMVPDLMTACERFGPDLIVHEEAEMAAPLAARLAGIPNVNHSWASPIIPRDHAALIGTELAPLWRAFGMEPEPAGGRYRFLHLDTCPPSLQAADHAGAPAVQPLRPIGPRPSTEEPPPAWLGGLGRRTTAYVTLGTVPTFNSSLPVFGAVIGGLADQRIDLVVAVSGHHDPAELGPLPPHVHVERFVDQDLVLSRSHLAVVHGGPGSTVAALAHGLPVLLLTPDAPVFARVAGAVVASGAGRRIALADATADLVGAEVHLLLADPSYRRAAGRIAGEIRTMPSPATVVPVLEHLVARQRGRLAF